MPVRLVTGFLGAGKTTLVNRILRDAKVRYAVIVNEFGEIGIDGGLIADESADTLELANGCVCCSLKGDLVDALERFADTERFDEILIETTGIAAPLPLARDFASDYALTRAFRLDGIVTVIDARTLFARLEDTPETLEQILVADHFVINRIEQAPVPLAEIEARLARLNPFADFHEGLEAAATTLFGADHAALAPERLERFASDAAVHDHGHHDHGHAHAGAEPWTSASLTLDRPLDAMALTRWLDVVLADHANPVLRAKGMFDIAGEDRCIVMQSVGGALHGEPVRPWRPDEARISKLVLIGRRLDAAALKAGFEATAAV